MAKHGVRFKPEQIVSVLRQIEVLTANGNGLDEACKTLTITPQLLSLAQDVRWNEV